MTPPQALDTIQSQILMSGRDTRYKLEAYAFVLRGLNFYHTKSGERRHFTGQELAVGLIDFAYTQFGPCAHTVLTHWGIHTTNDIGNIVYNCIAIKLIHRQESDSIEDFSSVLDIAPYLQAKDPFDIDKEFVKSIKGA